MDTEEEIERAPWTMEQLESLLTDLIRAPTPPERFLLVDYTYLSYRALEDKVRAAGIPVPSLSLNRMLLHFGYENCQMRYVGASKELSVLASPRPRMEQFAYLESRAGKCGKEGIPVVCINTRVTSPLFCDPPAWRRVGLPRSQKPLPRFEIPREDLDRSPPLSVFAFDPVRALSVTSPESLAQARKDRRTSCPRLALEALACWWESVGSLTCPDAPSLFVILDLPGSTYDLPAPEMERDLKRFAAYIRKPIQIAYVPPMIYRWVAPAHTILLCSKKVRHHAKKGDGDIDIDARAITLSPRENLVFRPVDSVRMDFLDWPAGSVSKKEILLDDPINPEHPDRQYSRLTPGWNYLLDPR